MRKTGPLTPLSQTLYDRKSGALLDHGIPLGTVQGHEFVQHLLLGRVAQLLGASEDNPDLGIDNSFIEPMFQNWLGQDMDKMDGFPIG